MIADQPLTALGVEPRAVEGDDARRFLAAMLQRMQPERDDRRRVGMVEDAEHAAFLAQAVLGEVEAGVVLARPRRCPKPRSSLLWRPARKAPAAERSC